MVLLSPGQGSQQPGMLTSWLALPAAASTVRRWSELVGLDLVALGTSAEAPDLRPTEVAQPLLAAAALLSGRALLAGARPDLVCGHSIGELPALALAGVLSDDDAVVLAAARGRLMAEAAATQPTGMAAVLGGELDLVACAEAGLSVATVNAPGQVVLGGTVAALDAWQPPAGARVRRLDVAGAFHTVAMAPAVPGFARLVAALPAADAVCGVVANADGSVLHDGRELLDRLVDQLTRPVRFDLCLAAIAGEERAIELAPAGVLTALVRRGAPAVTTLALKSAADLPVAVSA